MAPKAAGAKAAGDKTMKARDPASYTPADIKQIGEQLRGAANKNDLDIVTSLLTMNKLETIVNDQDSFGNTALHIAANSGNVPIVKQLIDNKADVNIQDKYGQTPLIYASFAGVMDVVKYLVANKANLDKQTKFGQTALMKAAFGGSQHICQHLIVNGANVDLQSSDGRTAMMISAEHNNLKIVEHLWEQGHANLNAQNKSGQTALMLAAEKGCFLVVTYLAKVGAKLDVKNAAGETVYDVIDKTSSDQAQSRARIEAAIKKGIETRERELKNEADKKKALEDEKDNAK